MSDAGRKVHLQLRLYVAGRGDYTNRARQNLAALATSAGFAYDLELVDLRHEPKKAEVDAIVVTPTLVKLSPPPRAMVIGDLSDLRKLSAALGVSSPSERVEASRVKMYLKDSATPACGTRDPAALGRDRGSPGAEVRTQRLPR